MNAINNGNNTTYWSDKEKNLNGLLIRRYSRAKIREGDAHELTLYKATGE